MADIEAERAERRKRFLEWPIEKEFPTCIGDYVLSRTDRQDGWIYYAFAYTNTKNGWTVHVLFNEETMDYMIKTDFRLFVMTDIDLLTGSFDVFRRELPEILPRNIKKVLENRKMLSVLVQGKAFTSWDWKEVLPPKAGSYTRVIDPSEPVCGLNGSYVIAAYECRDNGSGVLFFYNMYRDDYYGEIRSGGVPVIVHQYDAKSAQELGEHIRKHLMEDLESLDVENGGKTPADAAVAEKSTV